MFDMKLIIGLGNPGPQYAQTRHNMGFFVVDRLADRHRLSGSKQRFHGRLLSGIVADQRCLLLQPMTYMNRSGIAVTEATHYYKLDPAEQIMVLVDDVALAFGRLRLRASGSPGGHNGLADIERALGTSHYPRLRIGIDPPGRMPQIDYVLNRFKPDQLNALPDIADTACDCLEYWLTNGLDKAMSKYNTATEL